MEIITMGIEKLLPAKYNPRKDLKSGDKEYEKIKRSIAEFGYVDPIVWNKRTGHIIGGHQRLKILQEMGIKQIGVSVVDLNEEKEKALNLALNKVGGDWDMPKLKDLLEKLDTGMFDVTVTGFDEEEIEQLMTKTSPTDIEDLLKELDMSEAIEKPIWAVVRTSAKNQELLERVIILLEQNGLRVERSYET